MVRIPVPSFLTAITLGNCLWSCSIFLVLWSLAIFCLSPLLMFAGIQMPWMPHYINIIYLALGMPIGAFLIKCSLHFGSEGFRGLRNAYTISNARRVYFAIVPELNGKLVGEIRAVGGDRGERAFRFRTTLQESMSDPVFKLAKDTYEQKSSLLPDGAARVEAFSKQARKVVELLERQQRDASALEADMGMIDKMLVDHLYLISRLNQMETTSDRGKILLGRLAEFQKRFQLVDAAKQEVLAIEERLAFIHDALCFSGISAGVQERLYTPSPLLAELQGMSWASEA